MSLELRVAATLKEAGEMITPTPSAGAPPILAAPTPRRGSHPVAAFLVGVVGVLILGAAALFIGPYDPNAIDPGASQGLDTVEIGDLAVTVVDSEPTIEDPSIWIGRPGPSPQFDTSSLGPDLSFTPGEPARSHLDPRMTGAVYLGELDDRPFYLFSRPPPSVFDWFSEILAGNLSGQIIGTSLDCCTGGDMDHEGGFPGISSSQSDNAPPVVVAQWIGLSPEVSVVAYQFDGEFIGWQTPVGGISVIQPAALPTEYAIFAYGADGEELDRFGPMEIPDFGGFAARSLIRTRGGVEIGLEDIPSLELRSHVQLESTDILFAVPVDGFQVYATVTEDGDAHVYATSCNVLEMAHLGGWSGTCLERTVDGQRVTGVFPYEPDEGSPGEGQTPTSTG